MSASTAADPHASTLEALRRALGGSELCTATFRDNLRVYVKPEVLTKTLTTLKNECGFASLAELGCTDYLKYPNRTGPRFEVHYCLLNMDTHERIVVKVRLDDPDPSLPSCMPLWNGADWLEREVFDMYGVRFEGHPDLRRILMPDEFVSYPLRKDYPLRGRGERHNFPRITRGES